ncbi:carcinoembryonic antigen-related cell adhesion molecule 20-like isoform X2 [Danio aesculapii]|uniref:carcinoembryonic antigen-related cell adhesion molecule 20-like isoform X2 n=1 Tax=Danio aesculapii TaxID=1142201 RepID=UPI0024C0A7DC|nr:carcinoembryonic antigen-related cell adhesion molecule 20-like isoform X2 [Danio aesculapii]
MMAPRGLYWTLWTLACFGQYFGQDLQLPELPSFEEGQSVTFTPENPPSTWRQTTWTYNIDTSIITAASGAVLVNPDYERRVSFDSNTLALELRNLKLNDSGKYKLSVVTSPGASITAETSLQVFETIYHVMLIGPEETLIEGESSANITSEGSGTITSVQWMKDNSPLSSSNRIIFSSDNRSVSISPVQRSDAGEYQCTYSNPVSSEMAKLTLTINYGPDGVSIRGPDVVDSGVQVFLSCSANSEPSASFSWTFNGSDTGVTTDKFTIDKTDFTDSGEYICTAFNRVTNKREFKTHALIVQEADGRGGGLSAGAIAGIVIGVLVAVGGICGLIVYLTKTNKIPNLSLQQKEQARAQRGQEPDLHYEEIPDSARENTINLEKINEAQTYENVAYKNEYENLKHGVLNQPRAPQPQVSNPPPVRR